MKKIIYTTALCAALFTTSCNFLDDNPQGIMSDKEATSVVTTCKRYSPIPMSC